MTAQQQDRGALFHGLRVLEFSWFAAGPIPAMWLAQHGADVVRVESAQHPDALRFGQPRPPDADLQDPNACAYFNNFNAGKRSIILEMGAPHATESAKRLIRWADIVIENFRPSVMRRWGLDYPTVAAGRPDLIYVAMPAVGLEGPRAHYGGFGTGIKQFAGLTLVGGFDGRPPDVPPQAFPDYVINSGHAGTAILAALLHREATGEGQFIEIAQVESTAAITGTAILEYTVNGTVPSRPGNRHPSFCPHGVFPAAGEEQWVVIAVRDHGEWEALCRVTDHAEWLRSDAFATLPARRRNAEDLERRLGEWTSSRSGHEVETLLGAAGVPCARVQTNQDLLDHDPHLRERGYYWTLEHKTLGPTRYDGPPFRLSESPAKPYGPAPLLGEHSFEVYREAGFTPEEIAALMAKGVISA